VSFVVPLKSSCSSNRCRLGDNNKVDFLQRKKNGHSFA
jgi:hypothetical protein